MATAQQEIKPESLEVVERTSDYSAEQRQLLINTVARDATPLEFQMFLELARALELNPFKKEIYLVKRWDADLGRNVATPQTGIAGYRCIAERTGDYVPGKDPTYDYDKDGRLISATAYVKKWARNEWHEISQTAFFDEYKQTKKSGELTSFWKRMPRLMLAKCAEALALRRAFPALLSGIYTHEEMGTEIKPDEIEPATTVAPSPSAITPDQKKRLVVLIKDLQEYGFKKEDLQTKMKDATGVDSINALDVQQAEEIAGVYEVWIKQLEEAAAENSSKNKDVPF